jgi:predicted phage baseplate assembly protein
MPLEAEIPKLDDRTFEQIFREARLRIPRYAPEWTDFNESDPGITLLQLGAWLTESTLYRLNRVPERNYLKFLQLLGLELRPALPAEVQLVFTPAGKVAPGLVPAGSRVAGQPSGGGDPAIFETAADLQPVAMPLTDVLVFDGGGFRPVTPLNDEPGTSFRPLGWVPQPASALYLGFEPPDPTRPGRVFPREIRLHCFLPAAATAGEPVACGTPPPAPPVDLVWEYKRTGASKTWRRLNLLADDSAAFTQDGAIQIAGPAETSDQLEPFPLSNTEPRFWLRCRLRSGAYPAGAAPEIDFVRVNAVRAVNLATVFEEVLGSADGLPGLTLTTRFKPVEAESLELWVEGADVEDERWLRVDDLLASGPDDPHFTLNATAGEVAFGDGTHGRIPPAGADVVARRYRWGGGTAGNLPADAIATPMTPLVGIDSVTNPRAAAGGRVEQTVDELKLQAPARLRHRSRAISAADFAAIAGDAGGVGRAHAIALAHPDHPGVEVPGAVTVIVVPDRGDSPRVPSAELLRSVCRYLEDFRLLTTEVYVRGPVYVSVSVAARLIVRRYAALDKVMRDVTARLDEYLDPLARGFGEDLYPTRLIDVILNVPDVVAVPLESFQLTVDGQPLPRDGREISIAPSSLVHSGEHQLVAEREEDD